MRERRGFTLVEFSVSVAMLGLVLVFIVNVLPGSLQALRRGEERIEQANLAGSILDRYRARDFADLNLGSQEQLPAVVGQSGISYQPSVRILQAGSGNPSRVLQVEVTLQWERKGQAQQAVFSSYVAKLRPQ